MASSFFSPAAPQALPDLRHPSADRWMLAGMGVAIAALIAGLSITGVSPRYFLQPTGAIVVLGCTLGVTLISTPRNALKSAARRIAELFRPRSASIQTLIDDLVMYARIASGAGTLSIENDGRAGNRPG